jgi:catechol 2,3-dioxygenase-like lactoylglutathione lyase family enzyme
MTEAAPENPRLQAGIVVRDLEAMTPFYRDGLGLAPVADLDLPHGRMRLFACGDAVLKLLQLKIPTTASNPPGGNLIGCTGFRWLTVSVDDIEDVVARCVEHGGNVVWPIEEYAPGLIVASVEDSEGNGWVELVERRGAPELGSS